MGNRPLNELRLILVGRGAVGKTSLVRRLVHGYFDPTEKKTEGIQITKFNARLTGTEDVRYNIWDFGGQEIMHATHQFFLSHRSLYLLVLNGRQGLEEVDAEYWLRLIDSFGGESPVIIVLNKIAEHPFTINRRALQAKFPAIRDFVRTDCESGLGIPELYEIIQRETGRIRHLRDGFPTSWFNIKQRLEDLEKNYLTFDDYRRICIEFSEKDEAAQDKLAGYLHNLGIALNYRDDARLQDTHVLNPHWVTNGIYRIINSSRLENQKGEITLAQTAEILTTPDYPPPMRRFIFDLMKRFELCFSFPDDDCHYLIPDLLDKQEPDDTAELDADDCLNFQYSYPVLPEGLLPRFIVRSQALSHGLARWRTGVMLKFEGNLALVKADLQDKRVSIHVTGPRESRRRLLAVIRSDFERIHRDIPNLQPKELVPMTGNSAVLIPYADLLLWEADNRENYSIAVPTIRLFVSYSHRDEGLRSELETHLKLLQRQGAIDMWTDARIEPGEAWSEVINQNLEAADLIVLLISADFLASDFCYNIEMRRALTRHEQKTAVLIPVIVRDVNWKSSPVAHLQALPTRGQAVTSWSNRDSAWRNVAQGIEHAAVRLAAEKVRVEGLGRRPG